MNKQNIKTFSRLNRDVSKDYTGKGKATYPNGDTYDGEFQGGVSSFTHLFCYLYLFVHIVESWRRWSLYICIQAEGW